MAAKPIVTLLIAVLFISADANISYFPSPMAQQQAQAACVGLTDGVGTVSAVPRSCGGAETCHSICAHLNLHAPDARRRVARSNICVNAMHIYTDAESTVAGVPGLKTKFESCDVANCGPNVCCCLSF